MPSDDLTFRRVGILPSGSGLPIQLPHALDLKSVLLKWLDGVPTPEHGNEENMLEQYERLLREWATH
jgi:hypothetical protein